MVKFLLTNNPSYFELGKDFILNKGFSQYTEYSDDNLYLVSFKKKIKKRPNLLVLQNGDFCGVVGTAIYGDNCSNNILSKIYEEYDGEPSNLRTKLIGNYVFFIRKNGVVKVFTDEYEIKECYYGELNSGWVITDSLECFAIVEKSIGIDLNSLIEKTFLVNTIGEQALWDGVKRLVGDSVIEYSLNDFCVNPLTRSNNIDTSYESMEEAVQKYVEMIKVETNKIYNCFGDNISINQTGGLDNRTVFSAFRSVGCTPNMIYGSGNSFLTSTKKEDRDICELYTKVFGNKLHDMDWKGEPQEAISNWSEQFFKYGFDSTLYGGTQNFFNEYESGIKPYPDFMECGYFLEALRLRDFAKDMESNEITLEYFIDNYLIGGAYGVVNGSIFECTDSLKESLVKKFAYSISGETKGYLIDKELIVTRDTFDQVRWLHARRTDSLMLNFINNYTSSIAIFSLKNIHDFPLSLPASWRDNAKFQIALINELEPKALELPFYTHRILHELDKKTMTLKPIFNFSFLLRKIAKVAGLKGKIKKSLIKVFYSLSNNTAGKNEVSDEEMVSALLKDIIESQSQALCLKVNIRKYTGATAYLYMLAQTLHIIKTAKSDR